MVGPSSRRVRGFTLIETLVALTISSLLVVLVATVFLVQNRYYAVQAERSGVQDVVRAVTELVATEVRATAVGGIVAAGPDSLVVRTPMAIGGKCGVTGRGAVVQFRGGVDGLETDEVAGFAVHDPTSAQWSYYYEDWGRLYRSLAPDECASYGADTTGAYDEFMELNRLAAHHGSAPPLGTLIMLFRETTFVLRSSELDPSALALFHGTYGEDPIEYATGIDSTARFQYRLSGSSGYVDVVTSVNLELIDAVRLVADARGRPRAGGTDDVTFGWSVNIPLRNVR